MVVQVDDVALIDPSIVELADLPLGWRAWRETSPRGRIGCLAAC
jgi:hypothetical protein